MRRRVVISSTLGNALEWFDFIVFGLFADTIAKLYFPTANPSNALLLTFATFGMAFAARPLGGLLFGVYADRFGRKRALVVMIMLMATGTGMLGVAPTYSAIGLAAPVMVLVARLIQGVSAGGEFGSASAMLIEFASPGRRGLYGSWQTVAQALALVLGSSLAFLLRSQLAPASFESWGWRVPFLLGVLIGPIGFYLRHQVDESPEFRNYLDSRRGVPSRPLQDVFSQHPRELTVAFCLTCAGTAVTYVGSVFLPVYASQELKLDIADAQFGLIVVSALSAVLALLAGHLSDRIGRRPVILPALVSYCLLFYLMLSRLVAAPSRLGLWQLQLVGALLGVIAGPMPALMTEIFPVGVRSTGSSLMYNLAVMLFGGLAPFINSSLVKFTGDRTAPVYYVLFAAEVGLVGLLLHRESELVSS